MLLYYITDRTQFPGPEPSRRELLLNRIAEAARAGVDYIQLREKDLPSGQLEGLARDVVRAVREQSSTARVLINSRTDIAIASGTDGVHLRSHDISPADVRRIWHAAGAQSEPVVAVSCHTSEEVSSAKLAGADFVVFGPVFGKSTQSGVGLAALRDACSYRIPVFALGGITTENAASCVHAGAAGVAAIRLFHRTDLIETVSLLRGRTRN